jgi:hypothetical protein
MTFGEERKSRFALVRIGYDEFGILERQLENTRDSEVGIWIVVNACLDEGESREI